MFLELNDDILQEVIEEKKNVLVQYSAGWCGNCRIMKPKFKRFSEELEDYEFIVVDAERFPKSRELANVSNLPTFAAFKAGEFKGQIQTNKAESLKQFINEVTGN
ncbi:MAG: thioredoxin family protein [Flavobacteriales bacterium]|nr:thioredoxin family protein [Flavobacteriales bacterium]